MDSWISYVADDFGFVQLKFKTNFFIKRKINGEEKYCIVNEGYFSNKTKKIFIYWNHYSIYLLDLKICMLSIINFFNKIYWKDFGNIIQNLKNKQFLYYLIYILKKNTLNCFMKWIFVSLTIKKKYERWNNRITNSFGK